MLRPQRLQNVYPTQVTTLPFKLEGSHTQTLSARTGLLSLQAEWLLILGLFGKPFICDLPVMPYIPSSTQERNTKGKQP